MAPTSEMPGRGWLRESLRWCAPSILTLGALILGLNAVRMSAEGNFEASVMCVFAAAVLDALDGHTARYLNACTDIGFELDSLCDLANFGVTPTFVVYFWAKSLPRDECVSSGCSLDHLFLWAACSVYASCCALRLARFNVAGHAEQMEAQLMSPGEAQAVPVNTAMWRNLFQKKLYFKGVPAPMGATYALMPMLLYFSHLPSRVGAVGEVGAWAIGRRGTAFTMAITGALMVSTLPTLSSKMLKTSRGDTHLRSRRWSSILAKVVGSALLVAAFARAAFDTALVLVTAHLVTIPIGVGLYASIRDHAEKQA